MNQHSPSETGEKLYLGKHRLHDGQVTEESRVGTKGDDNLFLGVETEMYHTAEGPVPQLWGLSGVKRSGNRKWGQEKGSRIVTTLNGAEGF